MKISQTQIAALRALAERGYGAIEGGSEARRGKTRYYPARLYTSGGSFNRATYSALFRMSLIERVDVGGPVTLTIAAHTVIALAGGAA